MADILRFQTNIPETVVLAFDDGLPVEGRYGDQYLYTWEDERVSYLPPIVRDKLHKLEVAQGDSVQICKQEVKQGNRRSIQWAVERPNGHETSEPDSPPVAKPKSEPTHPPDNSGRSDSSTKPGNGGNGREHTPVPYVATGAGQFLLSALVNTIDICDAAEKYARTKGLEIHFEATDIRALAITAFIQHTKQNGGAV